MVSSLRILEIAAGIGLLFAPEKAEELAEELGKKIPEASGVKGLRTILG